MDSFVASIGTLDRRLFDKWEENEKIAFWVNAYNSLTLKVIIDNYPIKPTFPASLKYPKNSIRQIKGVWDKIEFIDHLLQKAWLPFESIDFIVKDDSIRIYKFTSEIYSELE